eukprot:6174713-Pleurochrysis_carterae.AAC.1
MQSTEDKYIVYGLSKDHTAYIIWWFYTITPQYSRRAQQEPGGKGKDWLRRQQQEQKAVKGRIVKQRAEEPKGRTIYMIRSRRSETKKRTRRKKSGQRARNIQYHINGGDRSIEKSSALRQVNATHPQGRGEKVQRTDQWLVSGPRRLCLERLPFSERAGKRGAKVRRSNR